MSCIVYENAAEETDEHGLPPHSISVVFSGGNARAVAAVVFAKKAPGIITYGTLPVPVTDAYGVSHTQNLMRAVTDQVALTVELQPLAGFDAGAMPEKIKEALIAYSSTMQIGQDLVIPSLYQVCYAVDTNPQPTFSISLISAVLAGHTYAGVLPAAWNHRLTLPAAMIHIYIPPSN